METKGRLVAGSHNRNEFVLINADEIGRVTSVKELTGQICQICGDEIEFDVDWEPFVACNECTFPVCRPCYEYERREGNQACPQCKTRYKRIKGICADIAASKYEHWSSLAPLPFEVVISAGQKAREDSWDGKEISRACYQLQWG